MGVVALGAVFGRFEFAVLGFVGWIGALAYGSMRQTQSAQPVDAGIADSVSNANRVRIAPIRRLCREIEETVEKNVGNPVIKVIGAESLKQAHGILEQSVRMLALREELSHAVANRYKTSKAIQDLEAQLGAAQGPEAESLNSAIEARKLEAKHFDAADAGIERIDGGLRQAEAALSELKSRLAVTAAEAKQADGSAEGLEETIGRLRALGSSLDEAEAMVKGTEA